MILPYALEFNLPYIAAERRQTLKQIFGLDCDGSDKDLVTAVTNFVQGLGLSVHLLDLNISPAEIIWDIIAEETLQMVLIKNNPHPVSVSDCWTVLAKMM